MVQIENDVYSQIGLVMLIGLAAKNAILIVEFAKDEFEKGRPLAEAALEGARLRLRPILMTSFAFILGCVPLWTASGAGRGRPADHGHHGDRRDGGGQRDRHLPDPRDLLPGGEGLGGGCAPGCTRCFRNSPCPERETDHARANASDPDGRPLGGLHRRPELQASRHRGSRELFARRSRCRRRRPLPSPTSNGSRSSRTRSCRS